MAGLRLDVKTDAFAARKNGTPIVPGKPEESLILKRILHEKASLKMPPPSSHKSVTKAQVETLRKWIAQGAPWQEHWSFTAPVKAAPPEVSEAAWSKTAIDRFLYARLQREGLTPAAEADRRTLARRVALDATGLPPEPAEVEAFVKDTRPDAYERYVDKMLASVHYGEHRARYWLDAARYADTHGLHVDNYREMWLYRDWVIQAYNKNLRFDEFTRDQLAGDLIPNRTKEQWIASGFHRNNVTTNEGGVIEEEVEAMYAKDRVDTTGTVFLGLTVGCATCHDHKFDPITQKDFYSMAAFFRNTTQKPLDGNISDTPPVLFNPLPTFHCFGLTVGSLLPLFIGVKTVCHPSPLHVKEITKRVRLTKATILMATDTFISQYARASDEGDLASLRLAVCGAERVRDETRALLRRRCNMEILEGYGVTEAAPVVAANQPGNNKLGTVGKLMAGMEYKLEPVEGIPNAGRLFVRGPNVMKGYLKPDQPGVLHPLADGWHDTGDVVAVDDEGFIAIRGRVKRFAKIGGEMVSLAVVENCASALWPDNMHAAVALPDDRKGEQIVLLTDAKGANRAEIVAWAQNHGVPELAVPRRVFIVDQVPVLGTGKTDYGTVGRVARENLAAIEAKAAE